MNNLFNKLWRSDAIFKGACILSGIISVLVLMPLPITSYYEILLLIVAVSALWAFQNSIKLKDFISMANFLIISIFYIPAAYNFCNIRPSIRITFFIATAYFFFVAGHQLRSGRINRNLTEKEAKILRDEYLKAENLRREAEVDRMRVQKERQAIEKRRLKWEEESKQIKARMKLASVQTNNPYEILGVHESDSIETIKDVYRKLVQIYHPDKQQGSHELSRKQKAVLMARVNAGYEWILTHHG